MFFTTVKCFCVSLFLFLCVFLMFSNEWFEKGLMYPKLG